mgnify:CR=1 FL=1
MNNLRLFKIALAIVDSGDNMATRKIADCRLYPSKKNCSLTIAGTEEEVLRVAVRHAVEEHDHKNSPKLRADIKSLLKSE